MKKKLLILLPLLTLALTACNGFSLNPSGGSNYNPNNSFKDLETSFINSTDNQVRYVTLDKQSITLLPGYKYEFMIDTYKEGEQPDFAYHWSQEEWGSENEKVVTIDSKGVATAVAPGNTRIYGKIFTNIGAYCHVQVIAKELDSLSIKNARKTYILGSEFTPAFTCIAHYKGNVEEEVTPTNVDYSNVNTEVEGTYTVNVSYTFEGVAKSTSYEVKVVNNPTYEAKSLAYTVNDLYQDRTYGWYCPNTGNVKGLVIPVYFTDTATFFEETKEKVPDISKAKIKADLEKAFFGDKGPDGWNSVKSYYHTLSNGELNLNGIVSDWYEPGYSSADVTDGKKIEALVRSAVDWFFTNHPEEDMKTYDSDNNGVFDYLNIIYGCPDEAHGLSLYWGKISSSSSPIVEAKDGNPCVKFHMWASYDELYKDTKHSEVDSHVFTHETGHTFGLEDLYDYAGDIRAIGGSTMMFHNTHQQDPYSTLSIGWSKAIVPESSCVIELNDYQSSHEMILLSPNPESVDSPFDEYILVELYAPNGVNEFDSKYAWRGYYSDGPQEPGIRLWHVNATLAEQIEEGVYNFTTNPITDHWSVLAMSNSFGENHGSILGEDYYDYCLVFELRNDKTLTYKPTTKDDSCMTSDETLWHAGETFTITDYASQFVEGNKLDSGKSFPWKITIENIVTDGDGYKATINLENV